MGGVTGREIRSLPVVNAISAGGVVWRRGDKGNLAVVVGYQRDVTRWALPKGTPEVGETLEATALREVKEETGLTVSLGEKIGVVDYWFAREGRRYPKHVHHWLMTAIGGNLSAHDLEFDDVIWAPVGEALAQLTFETEQTILSKAAEMLGVAP